MAYTGTTLKAPRAGAKHRSPAGKYTRRRPISLDTYYIVQNLESVLKSARKICFWFSCPTNKLVRSPLEGMPKTIASF